MVPPKLLENIVILCFERRFSKQNSVIRLKSNILGPPNFWAGYTTVANLSSPKKARSCPKKASESQIAGLRHIYIKHAQPHTKQTLKHVKNIDITQAQSLKAYSFPVITLSCICFFINSIDHF